MELHVFGDWAASVPKKMAECKLNLRASIAEFFGMLFFVYIGLGTAVGFSTVRSSSFAQQSADQNATDSGLAITRSTEDLIDIIKINSSFGIATAMAFGMGILTMAYAIGHISGGQLNPAVTLGLVLSGNLGLLQGIANALAQFSGSLAASGLLYLMIPDAKESSLGSNSVAEGFSNGEAYLGEIMMSAALVFVVLMTVCDPTSKIAPMAPLAIGFTVFAAHTVLIPVDGCSINPARSLGPAVVSGTWKGIWIFLTAPLAGAVLAVIFWVLVSKDWNGVIEKERRDSSDTEKAM